MNSGRTAMTLGADYDIAAYLQKKGAVGVIAQLPRDGMLAREIAEANHASETTISDRINEAQELDLIEPSPKPEDHGNSIRYTLTRRGRHVQNKMRDIQLHLYYQEFREARRNVEDGREQLLEWLEDSEITSSQWPPDEDFPYTESR